MSKFMKTALFVWTLCILAFTVACCAKKAPHSVSVDMPAYKYVEQFIGYGNKYNVPTKMINDSIDDIVFYPLVRETYGFYSSENRQIVINNIIADDTVVLKKVVFHELGHLFGLPHDTTGIMQTHLDSYDIHLKYCPLEKGTLWESDVKKLFNDIKSLNK